MKHESGIGLQDEKGLGVEMKEGASPTKTEGPIVCDECRHKDLFQVLWP